MFKSENIILTIFSMLFIAKVYSDSPTKNLIGKSFSYVEMSYINSNGEVEIKDLGNDDISLILNNDSTAEFFWKADTGYKYHHFGKILNLKWISDTSGVWIAKWDPVDWELKTRFKYSNGKLEYTIDYIDPNSLKLMTTERAKLKLIRKK